MPSANLWGGKTHRFRKDLGQRDARVARTARHASRDPIIDFFDAKLTAARTGIVDRHGRAEDEIDETAKTQIFFTALKATNQAEKTAAIRRLAEIYSAWQDDNDLTRLTTALANFANNDASQLTSTIHKLLHGCLNEAGKIGDLTIPELVRLTEEQVDALQNGTICLYFPSHGIRGLHPVK